jgi:hypothetical protein
LFVVAALYAATMRGGHIAMVATVLAILSLATLFAAYRLMNSRTFQLYGEAVPRVETSERS